MQLYHSPAPDPLDCAWKVLMRKPSGVCVALPSDATHTYFVMETGFISEGHGFLCYSSREAAEGAAPTELLQLREWRGHELVTARVTPVVRTHVADLGMYERITASNMFFHDVAPLHCTDGRAILPGGKFRVTGLPQPHTLRIEGDMDSLTRAPRGGKWVRNDRVGADWHDPLFRVRDDTVPAFLQQWEVGVIDARHFRKWVRPLLPTISTIAFSEHGGDTVTTTDPDAYRVVNEAGPANHVFIDLQRQ